MDAGYSPITHKRVKHSSPIEKALSLSDRELIHVTQHEIVRCILQSYGFLRALVEAILMGGERHECQGAVGVRDRPGERIRDEKI